MVETPDVHQDQRVIARRIGRIPHEKFVRFLGKLPVDRMDIVPGLVRAQIKDLRGVTAFPVDALRTFFHLSPGSSVGGKTDGDRLWIDGNQAGDRGRERSAVETKDVETADMLQPDQVASAGFRLKIQGKSEPAGGEIHRKPGPGLLSEHLILIDKIAFHDGRRQHEEIGRGDMKLYALTTGAGHRKRDGKLQPCHFQTQKDLQDQKQRELEQEDIQGEIHAVPQKGGGCHHHSDSVGDPDLSHDPTSSGQKAGIPPSGSLQGQTAR